MNTRLKDPGSAITHLIAMGGAVICSFPLMDMLPALVCVIPISTLWNVLF